MTSLRAGCDVSFPSGISVKNNAMIAFQKAWVWPCGQGVEEAVPKGRLRPALPVLSLMPSRLSLPLTHGGGRVCLYPLAGCCVLPGWTRVLCVV